MNYIKLFEEFEEKQFYIIDAGEYTDMNHNSINLDDYTKDIIGTIKKRLPKAFGHDQFSCFMIKGKFEVFIYERLNSLVEYTFFITKDDWIYLKAINYGGTIGKFTGLDFYKCDGIKGLISAIKYDFEKYQINTKLWYKLPDKFKNYGEEVVKGHFLTCNRQLLRTPIQFSMGEFPKQQVESILGKLPVKTKLDNVVNQIYQLHFYAESGKLRYSIPLYYIKESNQFICQALYVNELIFYACCGIKGLQELINFLF
jgi:hypothetical protein